MLGVFLKSLIRLGPLPSVSELLMTNEFNFTAACSKHVSRVKCFVRLLMCERDWASQASKQLEASMQLQ